VHWIEDGTKCRGSGAADMEFRSEVLKARRRILLAGTILVATAAVSGAFAADMPLVAKSVPEAVGWYFYGGLEAGGRFVVDEPPSGFGLTPASGGNPPNCVVGTTPIHPPAGPGPDQTITKCFLTASQTQSRAKFEEYGEIPTAPFLDWINLQAGTLDGKYALDIWGRSVGLNNQSYSLDVSQIGQQYFSFGWDQTPHLISTSAKTVFGGVGSTFLTVDPSLQSTLQPFMPSANANNQTGANARTDIQAIINNFEHPLTLFTQRDRASFGYWWTPTPDWDFSVDYWNEHRTGVRPTGIPYGWGTSANPRPTNPVEVPQPLDDTTQNAGAKGEYVGQTPWGTRWSTQVVYNGSFYDNSLKELDVQNPFCFTNCQVVPPKVGTNFFAPQLLRLGLYPSNMANAITWNGAIDLPLKARNVITVQYNDMRQDDTFVNTGTNGLVAPPVTLNGVPVTSLDGKVDTLLVNDVFTMRPTNDTKLVLRGRHYDVNNDTPSLHIDNWIFGDSGCASGPPNTNGTCPLTSPRNSLPISYTKDNASAEASWQAARWASIGGGYFFERWDRKFRDVNVTDEHMGKVYVDLTPTEIPGSTWGVHARGSYLFGARRYDKYDTREFVEEPGLQFSEVASNMRRFDVANRNRQKADVQVDFTPGTIFTISPNFGLRWDDYPDAVFNPLGVHSDHGWNTGIEVAAMLGPRIKLLAAYNYEQRHLNLAGGSGGANIPGLPLGCPQNTATATPNPDNIIGPLCTWRSDITQHYNTFLVAADIKMIPNTFDLRLEAVYTRASEANALTPCPSNNFNCNGIAINGADPASVNFGQFPTERTNFLRFNAIGQYHVDPVFVRQMGWVGEVVIKTRYTYERNRVDNWAINNLTPYVGTPDSPGAAPNADTELTGGSRSLFLAAFNPNYTAQVVALSVALKW
jgi:MtrB/PioB family decaheme-associated outer membrane protein